MIFLKDQHILFILDKQPLDHAKYNNKRITRPYTKVPHYTINPMLPSVSSFYN
ncbi:hypothetical protein Hanom_Chr16g01493911 [Helianthus anomalus]